MSVLIKMLANVARSTKSTYLFRFFYVPTINRLTAILAPHQTGSGRWYSTQKHSLGKVSVIHHKLASSIETKKKAVGRMKKSNEGLLSYGAKYEGPMKDGLPHGEGVMINTDGSELRGEFMNGKIWNVSGSLLFQTGDIHQGTGYAA